MSTIKASTPTGIFAIFSLIAVAALAAALLTIPMQVSAQSDDRDWKQSPTGLNVTAGDAAGELDITWHAHPQTSKTLSDYRVTWTPDGESFKTNDQTEWYAYPTTNQVSVTGLDAGATYKVRVRARYDNNKKSRWSAIVSGQTNAPTNTAATGQPTITGSAEVGETLTAATSAISDSNGLTNAVFSHQWVRSASGSDNDITGATTATYVITNADIDKAIKVRVSFTDDDGYSETLTSNATTSVPVPAPVIVPPEAPQIAQASHDVLVSNTGQTTASGVLIVGSHSGNKYSQAQQFTTGDNEDGYTLSSVQIYIRDFGGSDAARVSIYEADSSGKPSGSLYPLMNPGSVSNNSLNTFTAPANATLEKETKYLVVAEATSGSYQIGYTSSNAEDSGKANGWSINNKRHTRDSDSGSWSLSSVGTAKIHISVSGTITPSTDITVPDTWSLIPTGKGVGDKFRLIFLSSTKRNASPSSIGTYNTWIQDRAAAGHVDIRTYSDGFTVVGCTEDDDARDNTGTTYTNSDKGVPIYWVNGNKVADDYEDFYDGSWDDEAHDKDESGNNGPDTSQGSNYPFTGCDHDGTEDFDTALATPRSKALGSLFDIRLARLNSSTSGHGPLSSPLNDASRSSTRPMYGLSAVFVVVALSDDAKLSGLAIQGATNGESISLSPSFTANRGNYTATVPNNIDAVSLTATKNESNATVAITDDDDTNTKNQADLDLIVGDTNLTVTVTAQDGSTKTYTITVTRTTTSTLVSNTGQTRTNESGAVQSQPFTTGSNPGGYTLTSVDVGFQGDNVRTRLFRIVPTQSNGEPDLSDSTKFITLTTPGTTTANKIHTFRAPADAKLAANTTYHLYLANSDGGPPANIHRVSSQAEDDGGAPGWSIGNKRYWRNSNSGPWTQDITNMVRMQINGLPVEPPALVSHNWSLTPSELGARDKFRLLFLSSTTRNATSSDIEDYNTFIQNRAAAGHTDIQAYSNGFKVVGCTAAIDARNNTRTTFTSSDRGVPIYWMSGTKVADHYSDFYDGSWDNASNTHDRNELGINSTNTNQAGNRPWTGCNQNGTEAIFGGTSYALGKATPNTGDLSANTPISSALLSAAASLRPMYGLSQLFEVPPDPTLGDLVLESAANSEIISLSPTFDDDTFAYTAAVPTGIDAVRLTATTNDSHSTVAITGDSDASTPNTADFDLNLGANTFSLTVTAEDGTTQTYTITITQLGTPPPPATVTSNWSLTPDGVSGGQQFRLIFYSSTKRNAQSDDIEDYNTFVQDRAAAGHVAIRQYSDGFTAVGCTEDADARDNTQTRYTDSNTGVPIYWLAGLKVADNYRDFYDGSWDEESNAQDRNEVGNTGPNSSLAENYPWTGCDHDGTQAFLTTGESAALGNTNGNDVRMGKPGSTVGTDGPLNGDQEEDPADSLPMYGLSQVFTVLPGNTGTLTTGGTPRSDTLGSSDTGHYWQVYLHKNVRYQIDVKGSERSQPGGTITNPWLKLIAGSDRIELLNGSSAGVSQTGTGTEATGGGAGQNSRLDIKVIEATDGGQYYHLLVHRADGDDGSYTVTVTRLDWPDGRRAPDITVVQENQNNAEISWTESKKTHNSLVAPEGQYEIEYRTLSNTNWTNSQTVSKSTRDATITGLSRNTAYEVRVRMIPPADSTHTYRWGYARVYTTN